MKYREFGNTGWSISALGFGAMRLPMTEIDGENHVDMDRAIEAIHRAFDLGVNYIDSAYMYCQSESEVVVGCALKGWRDRVRLSTKMPVGRVKKTEDGRRLLEEQLQKLDTDHIDFYHFHGLGWNKFSDIVLGLNVLEDMRKAQQEGLVRHLSFSTHDQPENVIKLIETGEFDSMLCQYNLLDRRYEPAIKRAREQGMGTVVMGPVGGGRLGMPNSLVENAVDRRGATTPEIALRFVLSNPDVCCALSGMGSVQMVEENAAVADNDTLLQPEEREQIEAAMNECKRLADLYCTGCEYCMPCPNDVNIAKVFEAMNWHRVYGITDHAARIYNAIGDKWIKGLRADACSACGECLDKCPQDIDIPGQMQEVDRVLGPMIL